MVERCGLSSEEFDRLVADVVSRGYEVPNSIARLGQVARSANVRMLSHDDASPAMRRSFRAQGVGIAEFPVNEETAREAAKGAISLCSARPMSCAAAAIPAGPRRPTSSQRSFAPSLR